VSVFEDFSKYVDRYGLTQITPGEPALTTDNGALFTVEYFLLLNEQNKRIELERLKIVFKSLEQKTDNGVVTLRYPGCRTTDSMDNATALIVFSELFDGSRLSKELYKHGELTTARRIDDAQDEARSFKYYPIAWLYNKCNPPRQFYNVRPYDWSIQSWWGRSPGFMGLLELSALDRTSWFRLFALWLGQFLPLFQPKNETSDKKLTYIVWQWLKTRGKFWNLSYKLWCFLLTRIHKNGMQDVYRIYFGDDHPLTKHTPRYLE
jgi:hypothetical protein